MPRSAHLRHTCLSCLLALALLLVAGVPASAQGLGGRVGLSFNPDQFYAGGHYESPALFENVFFKPNAELGFGDDLTTLALNFEFIYKVPLSDDWSVYGGAGPALNIYSFDDDVNDGTDLEAGLSLVFGGELRQGLFVEMKVGALDTPDLKFGVGYTWRE